MTQPEHRAGESHFSKGTAEDASLDVGGGIVQLSAARAKASEEAGAAIARQFNGPLTALLLYMNEIKQHSHQFSHAPGNRIYLQQVIENALQQTERVCAMLKQISDNHPARGSEGRPVPDAMLAPESGQKPLTKREREVLNLISEGCSNKQGAQRMSISPRTFESHRAEAMRKLGARNTADLVRKALLQPA